MDRSYGVIEDMPENTLWNRRFVSLLIAQIGFGFANSSFLMLPKFLATELGAGPEQIGTVVAVSAISIVFFLIPAGSMVDRHGRKHFLSAGAVLMALTSACYVFVHEVGVFLYVLRLLQSVAFAYAYAAGAALCIDASPPNRLGQAIGLFGLSYVVMGAFAPAAVETVVASHGWNAAFLIAAAMSLLCALLSVFVREYAMERGATPHVALLTILKRPEIRRASLVIGLLGVAFGCAFNFYQPFALSLGIYELRDFFIAHSLAAACCRLGLGPFIDRIGLRKVSLASLALYTVVIFAMTWLDRIGLVVLGLGMGVAHGLFYPSYTAMVLAGCPPAERGRRMSIIQAGLNIGIGLGGITLGWIAAHWGYPVIFELAALTLVVGAVLIATDPARSVGAPEASAIVPTGMLVEPPDLAALSESTLER
jgi:MFS family permease